MNQPDPALVADVRARLVRRGAANGQGAAVVSALAATPGLRGSADLVRESDLVSAELTGAGPLQPLVEDPEVTDVLVNGPDAVFVDRGRGLERVPVRLGGPDQVRALAVRLAAVSGRRLDAASPFVDARLPQGVRLHAVLAPVSASGTLISLRIPARRTFTLAELVAADMVPRPWAGLLRAVVRSRRSFLISGGTGSGKTTLLATMLGLGEPLDRVVVVEDTTELAPPVGHVVGLQARQPNSDGRGEVGLSTLVRQALRMRPDRLVVGECRGAEVMDLLTALNTGHTGGCGTVHANSAADVPARLEALGLLAGVPRAALVRQIASALDLVLHVERGPEGRRLVEIGVVEDLDDTVLVRPAWTLDAHGRPFPGPAADTLGRLLDGAR